MEKRIPYGISDYKELIEQNCYYVDKTMYLSEIENAGNVLVYLRPRRFGKTLFTSMISYYYDVASSDLYDELFKDTYVYNNPTPNKNNYYILKFDFSGMNSATTLEETKTLFNNKVIRAIERFNNQYNITIDLDYTLSGPQLLAQFLTNVKIDKKIYILIDEYDTFTNSILSSDKTLFKNLLGKDGFIRDFYAIIKEARGSIVGRVFITGVCSISLDSMTSGFNISTNISVKPRFNAMTALTHDEVKTLIYDLNLENGEEAFNIMLENYDGYRFSNEETELVFNPTLTMYYLGNYQIDGKPPKELLDSNILSNYEQIRNIVRLSDDYLKIIEDIFDNGEVTTRLVTNFEFSENQKFSKDEIMSLLYYFGYLTMGIDEGRGPQLHIPNRVIEEVFVEYFIKVLKENNIEADSIRVDTGVTELLNTGDISIITNEVSKLLAKMSNRDFMNFDEKCIKSLYIGLIHNDGFEVYSEYPANS